MEFGLFNSQLNGFPDIPKNSKSYLTLCMEREEVK